MQNDECMKGELQNLILILLGAVAVLMLRKPLRFICAWLKVIRRRLKTGVCFRYQRSGKRERRNGLISDYCLRCGHAGGEHRKSYFSHYFND